MAKKTRIEIPSDVAAKVLFVSDRTCCICRLSRKPVQIHHLDENPANNDMNNLAVLCLDCHNDTMIQGGFGRKLNSEQVILYRDDWTRIVKQKRNNTALEAVQEQAMDHDSNFIEYITSVSEIYREIKEYVLLAGLYDSIGNYDLRDKYIEIALGETPSDQTICYLRGMQGKGNLIPSEVIERETSRYTQNKDYSQRARFYLDVGKDKEAALDYVRSVLEDLENNNLFSAAFYLKELVNEKLIEKLFEKAFRKATLDNDLWWQVRALQELEWKSELNELLFENEKFIEDSDDIHLRILLARAKGDKNKFFELRKELAQYTKIVEIDQKN
ncbi:HNH endonuclease signature motif containing protein [Paenibacillus amylolyticus]|uniref:HNH endonuclease signature motif containing protein n=1 Tax=Paenibacillus amylolyticus TaxID=1451 RepID=UPI00324281FB